MSRWKRTRIQTRFIGGFCLFVCLLLFGCTSGIGKFPDQGSNPCHSSKPSHCSDNTSSLTLWGTRELQTRFIVYLKCIINIFTLNSSPIRLPPQSMCFCSLSLSLLVSSFLGGGGVRTIPVAYGSSQARAWIAAVAASLGHSHSNSGSKSHLLTGKPNP